MAKKPKYRYEVFELEINETNQGKYIPFNILLPNDVEKVEGLLITNDAVINVGRVYFSVVEGELGTEQGLSLIGVSTGLGLSASIKEAYEKYKKDNVLNGKIQFTQATSGGDVYWTFLLDEYALGTINLQAYDKSEKFYSETVTPNRMRICSTLDNPGETFQEDEFAIRRYSGKPESFVKVNIEGNSREMYGFFKTSEFCRKVSSLNGLTNNDRATNNFPIAPFRVKVTLKCHIK